MDEVVGSQQAPRNPLTTLYGRVELTTEDRLRYMDDRLRRIEKMLEQLISDLKANPPG